MVNYRTLILRLAWRRIAQLEGAPRHGLRLLKPAPTYLRLVLGEAEHGPTDQSSRTRAASTSGGAAHSSDARSGSTQAIRASTDIRRSREK